MGKCDGGDGAGGCGADQRSALALGGRHAGLRLVYAELGSATLTFAGWGLLDLGAERR